MARDADRVMSLFEDEADLLIGIAGECRDREAMERYVVAGTTASYTLRWDRLETVVFHADADTLGFAAFGDMIVTEAGSERRLPFRMTFLAVRTSNGWKLRHLHGSIPTVVAAH